MGSRSVPPPTTERCLTGQQLYSLAASEITAYQKPRDRNPASPTLAVARPRDVASRSCLPVPNPGLTVHGPTRPCGCPASRRGRYPTRPSHRWASRRDRGSTRPSVVWPCAMNPGSILPMPLAEAEHHVEPRAYSIPLNPRRGLAGGGSTITTRNPLIHDKFLVTFTKIVINRHNL